MEEYRSRFNAADIDNRLDAVSKKAGCFYHDVANNRYLVFTDEAAKDKYLEEFDTSLIIGTITASDNSGDFGAEIYLNTPMYNAVFLGSTGNIINFTFDVKNKQGISTGEDVLITFTITRGANRTEIKQTKHFGQKVSFNADRYLGEGTNTISITVLGQTSLSSITVGVTYEVVNLTLVDYLDISKAYNLSKGAVDYLEIPYDVSGSYAKTMEWFIDGKQLEFNRSEDEILETTLVSRTKTIELSNLSHGRHNVQFRVGTRVNGEMFYSNILYRDFFITTGIDDHIMTSIAITIPSNNGIVNESNPLKIYDMVQYVSYDLKIASYSPLNIAKTEIEVYLDDSLLGTVVSTNSSVSTIPITSITDGDKILKLVAIETYFESELEYSVPVIVAPTTMNISEITEKLTLNFSANGRSNNSPNRDEWSYGDIIGTLTGFKWNNNSGWVNDRLEFDEGTEFHIANSPLANHDNGKTIEIEWKSKNVSNENAVICDLRDENGTGILITASGIYVTSYNKEELVEKYKSDEEVRVAIVINHPTRGTNKGLTFIYTNGILSRAINILEGDNYENNKELIIKGTSGAGLSLKAIRIYDMALTADQIFNNYTLYRNNLADMFELYDRNDIYESNVINPNKMATRLPVMIVTGDIPTLENTNDTDTQIVVDIEYINMQDTTRSFKMTKAAMRPQGTSSMGYPKKNFRIYTQKLDDTILEVNGKIVEDKLYAFKKNSIPVNCWCLKADYAESSGTHNTGSARLWGEAFKNAKVTCDLGEGNAHNVNEATVLRTKAQQSAIDNKYNYDVRTTIDGLPILLFYRPTLNDNIIFIGKYNFNNDKSTEAVFGFTNIPGFDNTRMQCWEFLNNGNDIGLFTDISQFYENVISDGKMKKGWELAFESRYPDTKTPDTTDLYNFATWVNECRFNMPFFYETKWQHLDVYKVAGYYCYLMRHAGADQFVKNAMLTSEDGEHFYFILYDNDTINGLNNTGDIAIEPTDNRDSVYANGSHKFAGYDSVLWNLLDRDAEFQTIVRAVDNALYTAGISYGTAIDMYDNQQADKWIERVYNLDAEYKYITPFTSAGINNLFMLQGKRDLHRKWWLSNRYSLYDSLFVSGAYKSGYVEIKCIDQTKPTQEFKVTSGYPIYYGYGINGNLRQRTETPINANEEVTFAIQEQVNLGDPIAIYGAPHIKKLDFSPMMDRIAVFQMAGIHDKDLGTKLETLIIGSPNKTNNTFTEVSGIKNALALTHLDITNCQALTSIDLSANSYLQELKAIGTNIAGVKFAKGSPINKLVLPNTFKQINFDSLPFLTAEGLQLEDPTSVESIKINNCPNLSNDFSWVYMWYLTKKVSNDKSKFEMDNIAWENVDYTQLLEFANIKNLILKGKVIISEGSQEIIDAIKDVFGDTVFNKTSDFYVQAPDGVYLSGPNTLLEGESARFVCAAFSKEDGKIQFSLPTSRTGCSIDPVSGTLTTTENGLATSDIVVRAVFITNSGKVVDTTMTVTIEKRTYPTAIEIVGDALLNTNKATYTLEATPTEITGLYTTNWTIGTEGQEYLEIENSNNNGCTLKKIKDGVIETTLTATLVKNVDGSTIITKTKNISVVIEGVVITKSSNAPLQACLYSNGLVAHKDYSEAWELALITANQLQPGNSADFGIFKPYRGTLLSFDEFKYFSGVNEILLYTFYGCYNLTNITLPQSITSIGKYAFDGCSSLKSVNIPEGVTSIGDYAFRGCRSFASINISENVSLGNYAFADCDSLGYVTLWGQNTLGNYAFKDCKNLKTFTIKDSISANSTSFVNCTGTLSIEKGDLPLQGLEYGKFDKLLLGEGVETISYTIPSTIKEVHVSSLEHWFSITIKSASCNPLYYGAKLYINGELVTSIVTPDSVTELKQYSLASISLTSLLIGVGVVSISSSALDEAVIETLSVAENNPKYDSRDSCNAIIETESNTLIYGTASATIPNSVTTIGAYAFYNQSMQSIIIPEGVTDIGMDAFYGCTGELTVNCNIPSSAFSRSKFTKVTIGESVTSIGETAFEDCSKLTAISIPSSVISIETCAFYNCSNLTTITIPENSQLTSIGGSAFRGCSSLASINIPDSVTSIESGAFYECSSLNRVSIPDSVTSIESNAFYYCTSLTSITIPENSQLTSIGSNAFNNCTSLTSIAIPDGVTSLGNSAFRDCSSLTSITIPENSQLTSIGGYAFNGCSSLTAITLPEGVTSIGSETFYGCIGIKSITSKRPAAPTVSYSTFGTATSNYTGRNTYNTGENILYVPQGATGYDTSYWIDTLLNPGKCGFTISYSL